MPGSKETISSEETITRYLKNRFHVRRRNKKLQIKAFSPLFDATENIYIISVFRTSFLLSEDEIWDLVDSLNIKDMGKCEFCLQLDVSTIQSEEMDVVADDSKGQHKLHAHLIFSNDDEKRNDEINFLFNYCKNKLKLRNSESEQMDNS